MGSKEYECEIIDESAGGYQISGTTLPATPPTTSVDLTRDTGAHRLRVVWSQTVHNTVHIGLQRILEEEVVIQPHSTWIVIVAIVLGVVGGYLLVF